MDAIKTKLSTQDAINVAKQTARFAGLDNVPNAVSGRSTIDQQALSDLVAALKESARSDFALSSDFLKNGGLPCTLALANALNKAGFDARTASIKGVITSISVCKKV